MKADIISIHVPLTDSTRYMFNAEVFARPIRGSFSSIHRAAALSMKPRFCWFKAMKCGSTFIGSLTYFIKPALSPFFAWLFLGEAITGRIVLGVALMLFGALLSLKKVPAEKENMKAIPAKVRL